MKIRFFNPSKQYLKYKKELDSTWENIATNGDLILRSDVELFEKNLAEYVGVEYAVGLNSCTDALYLSLKYLGIKEGDEVLVPSRTFVATVQVIVQLGATPIYYDLGGINKEKFYSSKIKAIIPVHIEGAFDNQFDEILDLARENNWYVIEDAAQALGATLDGAKAGSFGLTGCFSFYPAKILGAFGDAGALVTDNKKLYEWAKEARNHFKNTNADWGINSRLDNLQAGLLNVKLKDLDNNLKRRKEIAELYRSKLKGVYKPTHSEGRVWQDYIICVDSKEQRDNLFNFLNEKEIETIKNNYPFPVPKLPLAQDYEDRTLRLPCNETLSDYEIEEVIEKVNEFFQ